MRNLTKAQAVAALKRVAKHHGVEPFSLEPQTQGNGAAWAYSGKPALVRDYGSWSTTTRWAIVWEEGPYDWSVMLAPDVTGAAVFHEAIDGFSVGLYPA